MAKHTHLELINLDPIRRHLDVMRRVCGKAATELCQVKFETVWSWLKAVISDKNLNNKKIIKKNGWVST